MTLAEGQVVFDRATMRLGRIVPSTGTGEVHPDRACVWLEPLEGGQGQEWLADRENLEPPR